MYSAEDVLLELDKTEKNAVKQTIENCVKALRMDPVLREAIRRNEMTCRLDISQNMPWKRRGTAITDTDINQIRLYLERKYELMSEKKIRTAIDIVASDNSYHPIRNYLESLQWDGEKRICHLLPKFLGADDNEYTEEIMQLLMLASISRIYEPGCKFEIMVCLVGGQGAGKSTFFRFLACEDEWFSDDIRRLDDDNIYRKLQGHWIIEMSEMMATVNAKSIEEIKSFISRQKESYKIPYETHPEDRPRQCIFVGTSNNLDFLPLDRTGNRRFAPVLIHTERIEHHILENEEASRKYIIQAWAEAMEIFRKGNIRLKLSEKTEAYLKKLQTEFMPEDTQAGVIQAWLDATEEEYVCSRMIYFEVFDHGDTEPKTWELRDISSIMNESIHGWKMIGSTHRFGKYGIQRGWKRNTDKDGFSKIPEGAEIPFKDRS